MIVELIGLPGYKTKPEKVEVYGLEETGRGWNVRILIDGKLWFGEVEEVEI